MNEQAWRLLEKHATVVLPEEIDHSVYVMMLEALIEKRSEPIKLYCRGDGGDTRAALAIVDLLRQHGQVIGFLAGEANSSSAVIWAGTARRYVYPLGAIGLHKVSLGSLNTRVDSLYAAQIAREYTITEERIAALLESISTRSAGKWSDLINDAGSGGIKQIFADELISLKMAQPISDYKLE
jgi:ATP-dependent protease ClpP protease subunit